MDTKNQEQKQIKVITAIIHSNRGVTAFAEINNNKVEATLMQNLPAECGQASATVPNSMYVLSQLLNTYEQGTLKGIIFVTGILATKCSNVMTMTEELWNKRIINKDPAKCRELTNEELQLYVSLIQGLRKHLGNVIIKSEGVCPNKVPSAQEIALGQARQLAPGELILVEMATKAKELVDAELTGYGAVNTPTFNAGVLTPANDVVI